MFINGLGDFNICRCFPKPDPTSLLVAPMRLLGIGSFRGVTWRRSSSPSPQSMRHNPKRRPSSCATPLFPASCARLRRSGQARTVEELCKKFMEDYSKKRNKPSTRVGYQGVIDRCIIPLLGRKKVHDVKRPDVAGLMEKLSYKQTEANKAFSILRKMFSMSARRCPKSRLCAVGGCRRSRRQGRSVPCTLAPWRPSTPPDCLRCAVLATVPGNSARATGARSCRNCPFPRSIPH